MPKTTERSAVATPQSDSIRNSCSNQTLRLKALNTLCDKWKSFSGDYFVGNDGYLYHRIKSGFYKRLKSGYCRSTRHSYQQVRGRFGTNRQYTVRVSRAVALAFVPNPHKHSDVDHINNNKADNSADNLQWLSHRDNLLKKSKDKEIRNAG